MPTISKQKKDKIAEQILHYLFTISPDNAFGSTISREIARDEEFTKSILQDLESKKLIISINKNKKGKEYIKRMRWRLSKEAHEIYSRAQNNQSQSGILQKYNNIYNNDELE